MKHEKHENTEEKVNESEQKTEQTPETQTDSAEAKASDSAENSDSKEESKSEEPKEKTPEERIAELEKENADLKDQLLRRAADFDNYRKRMMQEKQDAYDYGNANLLKDLLDSLDNFDRTLDAAKDAKDAKSIADGIKMINKSLVSMLENKYNLVAFGKEGDAFDPDLHEAIGMQEGKVKKEELAAVYLKGYKLKDRVIRHAKVMVVKPAE
ncbi:MAG: nucleotide exchange factor GrpE [Treponema sp.]|nr:nucleotide exchange factor GrpE [Treponema sp.]